MILKISMRQILQGVTQILQATKLVSKIVTLLIFSTFFSTTINATALQDKIKTLIPAKTYKTNEEFIKKIFNDEKSFYTGGNIDIERVIKTLKSNGFMPVKLKSPKNMMLSFNIFYSDNRPPSFIFLSYATSSVLKDMGYSYFYAAKAQKNSEKISITYRLNSESNIDASLIIKNLAKKGYKVLNAKRNAEGWEYSLRLISPQVANAESITSVKQSFEQKELSRINGKYWLQINGEKTLSISAKDGSIKDAGSNTTSIKVSKTRWYPKILMFDSDMNIIDSIMLTNPTTSYSIEITKGTKYVMITDNYNPTILRNGIVVEAR